MITERGRGMWARRPTITSVVVLVAAAGAGCSAAADGGPAASPAPRPPATIPADPAAALASAKARLGTESARFAQDMGSDVLSYTGIVNAETKNWEISSKEYVVRRVGTELYARASGKTLKSMLLSRAATDRLVAGGWVHTRLPHGRERSVVFNDKFPWNLANPVARATGITRTGNRSFSGTVPASESSSQERRDLRLSVDLDDQGRFIRISLVSGANPPAQKVLFTFSDFGAKADITAPPPGEVVEEDNPSFLSSLPLL